MQMKIVLVSHCVVKKQEAKNISEGRGTLKIIFNTLLQPNSN